MAKTIMGRTIPSQSAKSGSNQFTDLVRKKAYELYEKRGRKSGRAVDDWLEAERIVRQKTF
jgi:hypothetical protein